MFGFEHGWIFGFVVSRLLDGQEFWVLAFIVYSFSDLKNAKTLLSLSLFFFFWLLKETKCLLEKPHAHTQLIIYKTVI